MLDIGPHNVSVSGGFPFLPPPPPSPIAFLACFDIFPSRFFRLCFHHFSDRVFASGFSYLCALLQLLPEISLKGRTFTRKKVKFRHSSSNCICIPFFLAFCGNFAVIFSTIELPKPQSQLASLKA